MQSPLNLSNWLLKPRQFFNNEFLKGVLEKGLKKFLILEFQNKFPISC